MSKSIEYNGNKFKSLRNLCDFYNVPYYAIYFRINKGCSLEEALTEPVRNNRVVEFQGKKFKSTREFCRHYNLNATTFCNRRNMGWTIEECVYGKANKCGRPKFMGEIEFEGKKYKNFKSLCKDYNVNYENCRMRHYRGWTLKECIYGKGVNDA